MASRIQPDSYGLVFGVNTFMALFFQTILTLVVADDAGLALPPRTQVGSIISEYVTFYDKSHRKYENTSLIVFISVYCLWRFLDSDQPSLCRLICGL